MQKAFYLLMLLVIFSCKKEKSENMLNSSEELKSELIGNLSDKGIYQAWRIIKQGKTFVFSGNFGIKTVQTDSFKDLSIFSVRTIEQERTSLLGQGFDGEVTTLNYNSGQLLVYKSESMSRSNRNAEIIQLPREEEHLIAVKGRNFIIATGLYERGRYLYYSIDTKEANYYLSYPKHPQYSNLSEKMKGILYASSVIRISPDESMFVCGDMYSGNIDFCRINNKKIERMNQICLHVPEVFFTEGCVQYSQKNRLGFSDITVSKEKVYALYSGKSYNDDPKHFAACQIIMVFNWFGDLLNTYKLDHLVTSISYDEEENAIYTISHSPDTALLKINL